MLSVASAALILVAPAAAQFGIGARFGTTGVGAEATFGLTSRLGLRASLTAIPLEPELTLSDITYQIEPPSPIFALGADFNLGFFRLFGGLLMGADELTANGVYTNTVTIGDQTYVGSGTITARIESASVAPYGGIGFGRTIGRGVGLTLDLGAALLGEPTVRLSATGPVTSQPDYEANRQREQQRIQDDVDKYVKVYPMISLGLRIGI
jgi:hypothetical protein